MIQSISIADDNLLLDTPKLEKLSNRQAVLFPPDSGNYIVVPLDILVAAKQEDTEELYARNRWQALRYEQENLLKMIDSWVEHRCLREMLKYRAFQFYFCRLDRCNLIPK